MPTRMMKGLLLGLMACAFWACAGPPRLVRRIPGLRTFFAPRPYLDDPMFTFWLARGWKGPQKTPFGVRYRKHGENAVISVAFHPKGSSQWLAPEAYRRRMKESGSVEDSHILETVVISSHSASRIAYTTYVYDNEVLLGQNYEVRFTDMVMVPDPEGIYIARLDTLKSAYRKYAQDFERMLKSWKLRELPLVHD